MTTATKRRRNRSGKPSSGSLPEKKPPKELVEIGNNPTAINRLIRRLEVLDRPEHRPKDKARARIVSATIVGLQALLGSPCYAMEFKELETFLEQSLPGTSDKPAVIRLALYAVAREVRREVKLAHNDDLKSLKAFERRTHSNS